MYGSSADLSPNHTEALAMYGMSSTHLSVNNLEFLVRELVYYKPRTGVVIRAGAMGCVYAASDEYPARVNWCPAYWQDQTKVVDPTGAGNAFMGGLLAALEEGQDLHEGELRAGEC